MSGSFELETADLSTDEGRDMFWFRNGLDHRQWIEMAYESNVPLNDYPIFDVTEENLEDWLLIHNEMHKSIANYLNLGITPDLTVLDLEDDGSRVQWVDSHSQLHIRVNQVLGLL